MLCWSTRWCFLSPVAAASQAMYATRLYSAAGGGGGVKAGKRGGLTVLEAPTPHLHQHRAPLPPPEYSLYQGRPGDHRGAHLHHHYHPQHTPLAPPPMPSHCQHHGHFLSVGIPVTRSGGKKKSWNFIHEKMSYDTFFTMKRLIERSQRPDEVLRWLTQNPAKISHNHYPIALHKIAQLLQAAPPPPVDDAATATKCGRHVLEHPDFLLLCDAIINDCSKFDNFSIVNCLYAVAALGLRSDSQVVQVLEAESQSRLSQFNQKDISMVFSSSMKLHPGSQHPLTEACLLGLEKNLEREHHPQTLFLLLSYYRLKLHSLQLQGATTAADNTTSNPEQLLANRKILRLVKHTLASVSGVRDQEMALLDEMLAACAKEASNKSLEFIFSSHLFYQNRLERFIRSLAEELPKKEESISAYTMALIAKYIARHRLRETQLLDTIADFLLKRAEYLDSKVIQKLVFPFSRMSYRPSNEEKFFSRLEEVVDLKALSAPLATVNILMSLFQLGHFPSLILHRVFSPAFISNVTNSPCALIVRRYLSLLDAAVELEYHDYTGPRLQHSHKVLMFDHALTADEVNRKYSYKGLVGEALRQLLGQHHYKQDQVLPPGYYTDFVLWMDSSGRVLPIQSSAPLALGSTPAACGCSKRVPEVPDHIHKFSSSALPEECGQKAQEIGKTTGGAQEPFQSQHINSTAEATVPSGPRCPGDGGVPSDYGPYCVPVVEYYSSVAKEHSLESQDSSTLSSPPSDGPPPPAAPGSTGDAAPNSIFQFSIGKILEDEADTRLPDDQGEEFCKEVKRNDGSKADGGCPSPARLSPTGLPDPDEAEEKHIRRLVVSVNDKWHYCHNSDVLVGSRAMRDRHLKLLGYIILQLPYHELEKLNGIEQVKTYLHGKLQNIPR
ncbi:fas-activated serine/threonine kinase [Dunckerocampus dactyliophorus]|uniref:fas-activated serine/threonine kinase n=1 Tax=Dunckerocampus dactyliophorus TaxID=161453 RepID=UPI0024050AB4|nr:fas-activated serine/threonine kinase [Dunckerocampus dactyliophorus]XP_054625155.1 fas-activated serine/threonine kinase [Dunckerocampus dactyliophorus]XP_054625156.1 fas-activated serine/threonine kinase [Dunckerocampus dactyliophorus]